jgi:hypothetical protein
LSSAPSSFAAPPIPAASLISFTSTSTAPCVDKRVLDLGQGPGFTFRAHRFGGPGIVSQPKLTDFFCTAYQHMIISSRAPPIPAASLISFTSTSTAFCVNQ